MKDYDRESHELLARMCGALDQVAAAATKSSDGTLAVPCLEPAEPLSARAQERESRRRLQPRHVMVAAVLVTALVGLVAVARRDDSQTSRSSSIPEPPTFNLDLDGAQLTSDEQATATTADGVVWTIGDDSYLALMVRHGVGFDRDLPFGNPVNVDLPGRVWDETNEIGGSRVREIRWSRPDGDLWFLTVVGTVAADTDLAYRYVVAIAPPESSGSGYTLSEPGVDLIRKEAAGPVDTRTRTWTLDGFGITLRLSADGQAAGFTNLLHHGRLEEVDVADTSGWLVTSSIDPTILVGWDVGDHGWATLVIPVELDDRVDEIVAALTP